jgi:hypothetical protein
VKDLQESVDVSLMRYRGGTANYLDVLDSQRSLFQAELTVAQARNHDYQSLVQLYSPEYIVNEPVDRIPFPLPEPTRNRPRFRTDEQ